MADSTRGKRDAPNGLKRPSTGPSAGKRVFRGEQKNEYVKLDHIESDSDHSASQDNSSSTHRKRAAPNGLEKPSPGKRVCVEEQKFEELISGPIEADGEDASSTAEENDSETAAAKARFAQAGIIKSIRLVNFLCHEHFEIKLGPNVNYISGQNGTGKSAIMIAIQACFGARASDTGRGQSLGNLVRNAPDVSQGSVTITLLNAGEEAYQPEKFGDQIIIRRVIKKIGNSSYTISNSRGRKVSDKAHDLTEILDYFSIQVNNPCVMMNQDTAKEFLANATPSKLYALFLQATLLDRAREHIRATQSNIAAGNEYAQSLDAQTARLQREYQTAQRECKKANGIEEQHRKIVSLEAEYLSAYINEAAADVAEAQDKKKGVIAKQTKLVVKREDLEEKMRKRRQAKEDLNESIPKSESELDKWRHIAQEKRRALQSADNDLTRTRNKIKLATKKETRLNRQLAELNAEIKDLTQTSLVDISQEIEDHKERIAETQRDLNNARAEETEASKEHDAAQDKYEDLKQQVKSAQEDLRERRRPLQRARTELKQLQSQGSNNLPVYGPKTLNVLQAISNEQRWNEKPIGPIGAFIRLKQGATDWKVALEACLGKRLLRGYLVSTLADQKRLRAIFRQLRLPAAEQPSVFIQRCSTERYEVDRLRHRTDNKCVLDYLHVENKWLLRLIIDQASPEVYVLKATPEEATSFLVRSKAAGYKVKGAFLPDGTKMQMKVNNITTTPSSGRRSQYLQPDVQREIAAKQEEAERLGGEMKTLEATLAQIERRARAAEHALHAAAEKPKAIRRRIARLEATLDTLEATLPEQPEDVDVHVQEEMIEETTQSLATVEDEIKDMETTCETLQARCDDIEGQLHEAEQALQEIEATLTDKMAKNDSLFRDLEAYKQRVAGVGAEIQRVEDELVEAESELQTKQKLLSELEKNLPLEKRVETNKRPRALKKLIDELKKSVQESESGLQFSVQELNRRFANASEKLKQHEVAKKRTRARGAQMNRALDKRSNEWGLFVWRTARRANKYFHFYLRRQHHGGTIQFDHRRKELDFEVNPADKGAVSKSVAASSTSTKTLSGGEKSYATLAFIFALNEAMTAPIRVLDEFDVFMDALTRRNSMSMIGIVAQRAINRQFIFITPHDISHIEAEARNAVPGSIRIHRLKQVHR